MLKTLLGPNWSFAKEASVSLDISRGLRRDILPRILVCVVIVGLLSWVGLSIVALIWGAAVLMNETLDRLACRRLRDLEKPASARVLPFMLQNVSGTSIWAALGLVLWLTGDVVNMLFATALMIGTLVHVSVFYASSRVQLLINAVPVCLVMLVTLVTVLTSATLTTPEKALAGLALALLFGYVVTASFHTVSVSERLRALVEETERYAAEDPLTRLLNRRAFLEAVEERWKNDPNICLAFVDLDRFKPINDEFGHAVGDEVLRRIGARLSSGLDVIHASRLGGDEFAVLIQPSDPEAELDEIVERLHERLIAPIMVDTGEIYVGASLGYAVSPVDGETLPELLHAADTAMRRKKAERGGAARYEADLDSGAQPFASLETALRRALGSGQIRAALQPIVSAGDRRIVGHELLARWTDSEFARDPLPVEFIPVAEKLGLLNELLWTTLRQALPTLIGNELKLAVNISPSQLTSTRFLDRMCELLFEHGIVPARIELEITEQVAIRNVEQNAEILQTARARGFSIVMDDFGTGYSSLAMIDALPLNKLKLDRTFLRRSHDKISASEVLRATIQLTRELGIICCVEGIEDSESADLVTRLGCDELQGYWIGRPEIPDDTGSEMRLAS